MTNPKNIDFDKESIEDLMKRFDEISKNWPYDTSVPMTDDQLREQGAIDVTDENDGLGFFIGLGNMIGRPK